MRVVRRQLVFAKPQAGRAGNTLAEVLVSLLAFAIGAVAVCTLFPVAMLRSVNATKLTKATILRHNAEAMIDLHVNANGHKFLIHDPDRDVATPPMPTGTGYKEHYDPTVGRSRYIVDPLGWSMIEEESGIGEANTFGPMAGVNLPRFNGINNGAMTPTAAQRTAQRAFARNLVSLPDSWTQPFEAELTVSNPLPAMAPTTIEVTGIDTTDLNEVNNDTAPKRITVFDASGRFSHTRQITMIAGNTITVNPALPDTAVFNPVTARIETQEAQFTWLLTVRNQFDSTAAAANQPSRANVDVVVFFRRSFSTDDERVFALTPGDPTGRVYTVTIPGGVNRPLLKKGNWICDVVNARWYRIQRIRNETTATPQITLENAPPGGENLTQAMFVPGVVEVYHIGVK